ncbi:hypothetical protein Tco_0696900 [Tanacetum coccineum]
MIEVVNDVGNVVVIDMINDVVVNEVVIDVVVMDEVVIDVVAMDEVVIDVVVMDEVVMEEVSEVVGMWMVLDQQVCDGVQLVVLSVHLDP